MRRSFSVFSSVELFSGVCGFSGMFCQPVFQIKNRLPISLKAQAGKGLDTGHAGIRDLTKALAAADVGKMDFHRRDGNSLQGVAGLMMIPSASR